MTFILALLPGWAACVALKLPEPEVGCDSDFEKAEDIAERHCLNLVTLRLFAVEFMCNFRERRAVEFVAGWLLKRRCLDGPLLDVILQRADGPD